MFWLFFNTRENVYVNCSSWNVCSTQKAQGCLLSLFEKDMDVKDDCVSGSSFSLFKHPSLDSEWTFCPTISSAGIITFECQTFLLFAVKMALNIYVLSARFSNLPNGLLQLEGRPVWIRVVANVWDFFCGTLFRLEMVVVS